MTEFTIKMADVPVRVCVQHEVVRDYCAEYLTDEAPELTLCVTQEDIERERRDAEREDERNGKPPRRRRDEYLEKLALYRKLATSLLPWGVVLMHGAAIEADGAAYIFTAPSGTGKTTHLRLWRELLGERMRVINGDKPLLRVTDAGVRVYGTPWRGKERYGERCSAPLRAICLLERGEQNRIERITPETALDVLLRQVYRPDRPTDVIETMRSLDKVCRSVAFYRLHCNMELDAAKLSFETMSAEQ